MIKIPVVRNLIARAGLDLTDFEKKLQTMEKKLKKTARSLDKIGSSMTRNITLPIMGIAAVGTKTAIDLEENFNKINVVFENNSKVVKDWSETTLKSFGISQNAALDMSSTYGDMATSMGIVGNEAAKMSMALVERAGDISSFKNIALGEVNTALMGVFTGETESLKRLGVVMTVANLEAFALSKGIKTTYKEMSEAEKVNLRFQYVLEKTNNSAGDFQRTQGGAANQLRIAQQSFMETTASIMLNFLPALTKLLKSINKLFSWINGLDNGTKKFVMTILLVVAAIGPLLLLAAKLITAIQIMIPIALALGKGILFLNAAMLANPFTALAIGISLLILGFVMLWKKSDKFRQFWINLWEGIKNVFTSVVNFLISGLNLWIKSYIIIINAAVGLLNKLIKKANKIPGVNISMIPTLDSSNLQIPKLAEGGIAFGNSLVNVGEYANARSNPEVIAPLDKLQGMMGGSGNNVYKFYFDDREFAEIVADRMARNFRLNEG